MGQRIGDDCGPLWKGENFKLCAKKSTFSSFFFFSLICFIKFNYYTFFFLLAQLYHVQVVENNIIKCKDLTKKEKKKPVVICLSLKNNPSFFFFCYFVSCKGINVN